MVIRTLLILFLVLFGVFVMPVSAFDDSVQRYDVDFEEIWDITSSGDGSVSIINHPSTYSTAKAIRVYAQGDYFGNSGSATIKQDVSITNGYFAFTITAVDADYNSVRDDALVFNVYNVTTGSNIGAFSVGTELDNAGAGRYEFVRQGSTVSYDLYADGIDIGTFSLSQNVEEFYFGFRAYGYKNWGGSVNPVHSVYMYLDDFSTSSILGMNEQWTQTDTNIDTSYGIQSMASYPEAEFSIQVKKKNTGVLVNKTIITDPAGFVRWNRNDIFTGSYGDFRAYYYKDSAIYAYTDFTITDTTAPLDDITYDSVSWDQDLYYTGETAFITTQIKDIDTFSYSYYLDLYNTNDYLTTFEITDSEIISEYTFPTEWTDTSLLAKLMRVTDPYATNEVQLAYDISHFETLDWDTTVSFNKSSYNPSETLKVTWSGAADGSSVWLRAGDDGEVLESDVAYSGSFTFNVPANTTETYYIVDVVTGGYSQAQASCVISSVPDFFFNYSVAVDQDEYVHGDWVNVTYSTNEPAVIKVFDDTNADIWHYLDVPAAVTNETWMYYIGDTDPYGSFSVLFGNDNFLVSDYYSVVSSTSFVQVVPESMFMYETMRIWYITNGSSTLSITDSSDSILLQQTVNSSSLESISYIPTVSRILTITLSDVPADATDSIIVYWAEDPDDLPDEDVIDDDVIEDVLEDDETMTEYYNEKFRDFAPTIWGFFMLMCLLFLMAILTSFNSGGKRR